ncbi:alpha/beta-Hydrolases superfamily protein [Raphanus sativus]|uniref:Phospholipase A1 PLIP2, chloroplastic n=1 Tax=Raphanus sativus TaxID=3726 RepID=A0A6J0LQ49_RAPSA|nr:phospholipase A1 PLIP2, chloroplastic [Raphanus sativus]KAJ4895172.1 alpha/beta-Hydrolases superfamily protein [Raphanus sativus]
MDSLCLNTTLHGVIPAIKAVGSGVSGCGGGVVEVRANAATPSRKRGSFGFSFKLPLTPFWSRGGGIASRRRRSSGLALDDAVLVDSGTPIAEEETERRNGSWVLKILDVQSLWRDGEVVEEDEDDEEEEEEDEEGEPNDDVLLSPEDDEGGCDVSSILKDDKFKLDRDSFSKLLKRVSLPESKLYARMSYLGNLAYSISKIKPANLSKYYGLRFVTSSAEKTELALKDEVVSDETKPKVEEEKEEEVEGKEEKTRSKGHKISASAAYEMVASAASYLHSRTNNILPFTSSSKNENSDKSSDENSSSSEEEVASCLTESVTSVVAAEEDVKQAVADDLKSTISSPCDWFICDDDQTLTRFIVIQGSESLASWQANLLFEPIEFEELGAIVHRGIYEAAKGMYEQMLPEVKAHIKAHGNRAKFRFTGHSLGGSLSLLLNLMLLVRGEVPASSLLPVITFGAPFVLCGGDGLLKKLGLPKRHVQAITMHRDIVPRAFSCIYPYHVAELLKAVNGNFRSHPCLNKQSMLYSPMGELLILQPDESFSPGHDLLPPGNGLYLLEDTEEEEEEERLRAAQTVFLNTPHPLDILGDRSAYGSSGTIQRDHDMNSYLKAVRSVIRKEVSQIRRAKREHRRSLWWPIVVARESGSSGRQINGGQDFSGMMQTGRKSLQRFSRLVASQHMPLIVVLLFPVKLMFFGAFNVFNFR